jgi:hypothetical protein
VARGGFILLFALGCATPAVASHAVSPATPEPSGTLVVEVRRLADSALVPAARARLEQGGLLVTADAPAPPKEPEPVVLANVAPGRYLLRTLAIGYQGHRDTVRVRPNATDTIRTYLDIIRCDLDCPEVQLPRRPWWKFWPFAPTI